MQLAVRVGATLTASRLVRAITAWGRNEVSDSQASSSQSSGSSLTHVDGGGQLVVLDKTGASAFFSGLQVCPVIVPVPALELRDQTEFEISTILQYAESLKVMRDGCLHVCLDGVLAKTCGELNQYFCYIPAGGLVGAQEIGGWLPIQADVRGASLQIVRFWRSESAESLWVLRKMQIYPTLPWGRVESADALPEFGVGSGSKKPYPNLG